MADFHIDPADLPPREPIEYAEIPLRRPLAFLLPFLMTCILAVVAYVWSPRLFRSSTLILLEGERVPDVFVQRNVVEDRGRRLRLIKQEILSRTRLERVIKELDPYPQLAGKASPTELIERMRDAIEVKVREGEGFYIEYEHSNPYQAMAVTNRLATLFIEESSQVREQVISSAMQFIETQLDEAKRNLEENETALRAIKMKYMGSLPEELLSNIGSMQSLRLQLQTYSESLRSMEDRRTLLEGRLAEGLHAMGSATTTGLASLTDAATELNRVNQQLAEASQRYTEDHPEVRRLRGRVSKLQEHLKTAQSAPPPVVPSTLAPALVPVRDQLEQVKLEILNLQRKRDDVEQRIGELDTRVALTPKVEQELLALTRDHGKLQEVYQNMLSKKTDTEMSEKLEKNWKGDRYRMLDPAFLPEKPYRPILWKYLLGGVGLGLLAGLGVAVGFELLDQSIKNQRELEAIVPYPLLVTVPHISEWRVRGHDRAPQDVAVRA